MKKQKRCDAKNQQNNYSEGMDQKRVKRKHCYNYAEIFDKTRFILVQMLLYKRL